MAENTMNTANQAVDNRYFSTESLTVGYNGRALISDITLGLRRGEILTLIGPNGSGKSTILKSITRHLASISGVVYIDSLNMQKMNGRDVASRMVGRIDREGHARANDVW